jgi:carboxylate-amine ligase
VTDVCLTVDEAVMVAGLFRALARRCHGDVVQDEPVPSPPADLLRAATWRAARHGLEGDLIDVVGELCVPAREMLDTLLAFLRPALDESGAGDEVSGLVEQTVERGTGASRQRQAFARAGRMEDVADLIVAETAR